MTQDVITKIAILGGTGNKGSGLALRWARAGYDVAIGSRQLKAHTTAAELNERPGKELIHGMTRLLEQAAEGTPVVVVRGVLHTARNGAARELARSPEMDLFR